MRMLAATMVSITTITLVLFLYALVTYSAPVVAASS